MKPSTSSIAPLLKLILGALVLSGCEMAADAAPTDIADHVDRRSDVPQISGMSLRDAASDPETRAFYQANGWKAEWSGAMRDALTKSLDVRSRHGLDKLQFGADLNKSTNAAEIEVALTLTALRYAAALAFGATDPAKLHSLYTVPRPDRELGAELATALAAGSLGAWFDSLVPAGGDYAQLSQSYQIERAQVGSPDDMILSAGVIRTGDTDRRVPGIVRQLIGGDYLGAEQADAESEMYTQGLADVIKQLQRDFGIADDGVIGPDTLNVLNLGPGDRAQALAVALERLRWLPRTPPATRIDVNTAAARLAYFRDGKLIESRRVVVGKPGTETPQLQAPIFRLVANPTWTIPKSIQHGEMAGVSRSYLRRHNMVRKNGWIVQKPGPTNALGLVKFDMKNRYAIYLHDTSAPGLFGRSQRHLSHGCVRVEDAEGFAQRLAADEGVSAQWEKARAGGAQKFVSLPHEIPVRLLYRNVFVDSDGEIAFRTDPYGWNGAIASALGFVNGSTTSFRAEMTDVGP